MKKTGFILFLLLMSTNSGWALAPDGRTEMGPAARVGYVMMRAVGNTAGLPFEIPGTMVREYRMHSYVWPVTWIPRLFTNVAIRGAGIANDLLFQPFAAPFTNDISPFTEAFDLPEYPWQKE